MAFQNVYHLNVDLKPNMTYVTPTFKQGDSGVLKFRVYDEGKLYDLTGYVKSEITFKFKSGTYLTNTANLVGDEIVYELDKFDMLEKGIVKTVLTIYSNTGTVSIQPFSCFVFSDLKDNGSYIELIKDLQEILMDSINKFNDAIPKSEKGEPNGVATLDENGQIPLSQLPPIVAQNFEHIYKTVFKDKVHGMSIDEDGLFQYEDENGIMQYMLIGGGAVVTKYHTWKYF